MPSLDLALNNDQIEELSDNLESVKLENKVRLVELQKALEILNVKLPQYEVRNLINERFNSSPVDGSISLAELTSLYFDLKSKFDPNFRAKVHKASNVQILSATSEASQAIGIFHSVRNEEQVAFADWINSNLREDKDLHHLLPLNQTGDDLYEKMADGLILSKLINLAVPETIDERALNKKKLTAYTKLENLILVVNSARAIGCNIVNIDADDLSKAKKHLVLGLLWQIIRIGLFSQIDLVHVPGLIRLLQENETLSDLQRLSPEQILIRWVNYHLQQAGVDRRLTNFTTDIQDSEIYCYLLKQIAPVERYVTLDALKITNDNLKRADRMLKEAEKLDCRAFITSQDVVNGVYKLNLAFVANLFNTWPALKPPEEPEQIAELEAIAEETREERTYRNWMNSMAVDPYVNWLYSDLQDGLIIFQLYEKIKANVVDWKRVSTKFEKFRSMMQRIQNCNYAIDIGRQLRFSLVGIQGKDIYDGNPTLTLALIWQLMRAYTLTVLANCTKGISADSNDGTPALAADKDIIDWANNKLKNGGKTTQLSSFQDSRLSDGKILLDLIDCIKPASFDYGLVTEGKSADEKLTNAKYAITTARKIGAKVYALPEDIVEVKPKMVMTVFACLMARDFSSSVSNPVSSQLRNFQGSHDPTSHSTNGSSMAKSGQPPAPPQRTAYRIPDQLLRLKQGKSEESMEKSEADKDDSLSLSINEKSTTISSADDDNHSLPAAPKLGNSIESENQDWE